VLPYPNDPAAWQNFYVMMGGANAALTGLVFVALSIHLREVLDHPLLRPRAVIALTVLTTQIVIAAIVLVPQSAQLMGVEIFAVNAAFLAVDLRNRVPNAPITRARLLSFLIRMVYIASAISLMVGIGGGFYLLALVVTVTLARTMSSAWALLTALG
jgi:modulator of FtsH protease